MVEGQDIAKSRVPFNWAQLVTIIALAISVTDTLTTIYARFELTEASQKAFQEKMNERIIELEERVNYNDEEQTRRLNTITKRNSESIKDISKEMRQEIRQQHGTSNTDR